MPITDGDAVHRAVAVLAELATAADETAVAVLRERLTEHRLRVLIAGEAKRGKSTVLNRLLARDVLPTGVTPVTAVATTVRPTTEDEHLDVVFGDGRRERRMLDDLAALVTERQNPENRLGVADVTLRLRSPLLADYRLELVDTPGTGSVFAHNTAAAERAYDSLDAAIVVVSADPPISATERDLLVRVDELAVHTFVLMNKSDQLDPSDLSEAVEFTEAACERALGRRLTVFAGSARRGEADPGYRAFAAAFHDYLEKRSGADLAAALRRHVARLARSMLDAALLSERSLELSAGSAADRVATFAERVTAISARRRDLADRAWLAQRRVNRALEESGRDRNAALTAQIRGDTEALLDGALASRPVGEFEADGRTALVSMITDGVEAWRGEMSDVLERELNAISAQGLSELDAQLADLRAAADDLLGLDLTVSALDSPLRSSRRFGYSFDRGVAWELPLSELVGKIVPGRKHRARQRLLAEVGELVDRQIGRVRSDLAERFKLSVADVVTQLAAEHDEVLGRVRYALAEVGQLSDTADSERDARADQLHRRTNALRDLLTTLRPASDARLD